jgi:nucleolar protein 6
MFIKDVLIVCRAGGGGNTKDRRTKIGEKNQKLNEQRIRRFREEEKAKSVKNAASINQSAIHPSRRARVPDA